MAGVISSAKRFWLPISIVLVIQIGLSRSTANRFGITYDEYNHLPVGLWNLRTGEFDFDVLNPPLCRIVAALPLLGTHARSGPTDLPRMTTDWGEVFVAANRERYEQYFAIGRSMMVLLAAAAALVTALWARERFGDAAGCLAAFLWVCEPTLLAYGSLVTTDMGAAAFFIFTLYAVWKFAQRANLKRALVFGIVLGLAELTKFTCVILYPLSLAVFLIDRTAIARGEEQSDQAALGRRARGPVARRLNQAGLKPAGANLTGLWLAALVVSLVILNAGYLFHGSCSSLASYRFQSGPLRAVARILPAGLPVPLPRDYVAGIDRQAHVMEGKHTVYLDGDWSVTGFPFYYLWTLFYKLPHPFQILLIATAIWIAKSAGVARRKWTQLSILLPLVTMVAMAQSSPMQLGIRYVLPAIPFAILFVSQSAQGLSWAKSTRLRTAIVGALAVLMVLSVRYHPHHLAYFNELAGGPTGGRKHLLDSNLDWGQDLQGLKTYLDAQQVGEIGIAYFGGIRPERIGISHHSVPTHFPQPGIYAISTSFSEGRPLLNYRRDGGLDFDFDAFSYFTFGEFKPIAKIGYSIEVFNLTSDDIAKWHAARHEAMQTSTK